MYTLAEITIPDYKTMCIEHTITDLDVIPTTFNKLQDFAREKVITPKGYFVKYLDATNPSTQMPAQFCLVVDALSSGEGEIKPMELPGYSDKFLKSESVPFDKLGSEHERMHRYIKEKGYRPAARPLWELYNADHTGYILWPIE